MNKLKKFSIGIVLGLAVGLFATAPSSSAVEDPVIAAVGDIACPTTSSSYKNGFGTATLCRHKYVADLLPTRPVQEFLVVGDIQYENGNLSQFNSSYAKWFAPYYEMSRPVPGNHEYYTTNATGYYSYYASKPYTAAPGYYSYNVGTWHIVALNSNCAKIGGCGATTAQANWLKSDLTANPTACTIAYWHHPKFNSGSHSGVSNMNWAWNILYDRNADIIINGHEHSYQRFVPLSKSGARDNIRGITEFVVGMGGKSHYTSGATSSLSAFRNTSDYGMFFMTLHPASATYEFVNEAGAVLDSGTINCH